MEENWKGNQDCNKLGLISSGIHNCQWICEAVGIQSVYLELSHKGLANQRQRKYSTGELVKIGIIFRKVRDSSCC